MFKLMKVGTDVEFLYWDQQTREVVSATHFCGGEPALRSPIGTDGHSTTAELRTVPSRNVLVLLADLANSLGEVGKALDQINSKGGRQIVAVSQPMFAGEPLGGHIHLSFWSNASSREYSCEQAFLHLQNTMGWFVDLYHAKFGEGRNPHSYTYREQPCQLTKTPPNQQFRYATRVEYRRPPSWLATPYLAYSFLGLAKLSMMKDPENYNVLDLSSKESDLKYLPQAVEKSQRFFETARPPLLIDFQAWREILES